MRYYMCRYYKMAISAKSEMKNKMTHARNNGFVLPAVVMLMMLLLMFGVGRLAAYRYQAASRIESQKKTQDKMALESGISYLMSVLKTNSGFTNSETNRWINSELAYSVVGDGHRFEVSVYRQNTTETARAELVVYDTANSTNPINRVVTGMLRIH